MSSEVELNSIDCPSPKFILEVPLSHLLTFASEGLLLTRVFRDADFTPVVLVGVLFLCKKKADTFCLL